MKRFLISTVLTIVSTVVMCGSNSTIRDIDIKVVLAHDGSAEITEVWDVSVSEGTEWYLVRSNLGEIRIFDLNVHDSDGVPFQNIGSWDVNRSRMEKTGKCGIVDKGNGCEICWGIGEYGSHCFTVNYKMSNVVEAADDYDLLHMQFVSPGLSACPEHVKVSVCSHQDSLNEENTRIWGFGYRGTINYMDGAIEAESDGAFSSNSSIIMLLRFDKGLFQPSVQREESFDEILERALAGSDWEDDELSGRDIAKILSCILLMAAGGGWLGVKSTRKRREKILGVKREKDVPWCRDIPYGGNIPDSYYVLEKLRALEISSKETGGNVAAAMILRMIDCGVITAGRDSKGKIEMSFNDSGDFTRISQHAIELYGMMKEASGEDLILQDKEFSKWSSKHFKRVSDWLVGITEEGRSSLGKNGMFAQSQYSEKGQEEARKLVGLKKFLSDFTLASERRTAEVALWKDYLTFAALFGIAEKVSQELKDIHPKEIEESGTAVIDPYLYRDMVWQAGRLGNAITNARAKQQAKEAAAAAKSGRGGSASFGGGGGFHGGGLGGGAR